VEEIEVKTLSFRIIFGWLLVMVLALSACTPAATPTPSPAAPEQPAATPPPAQPTEQEEPEDLVSISAGWVGAIDQLGLPVAVEQGFFEDEGLDVTLAGPYPTGVDLLNALQAGEVQFGQVGVPAIGAILRGMDLVMLGNYTGSSTQLGIDETMAMVAREGSDIDSSDLANTLQGKTLGAAVGSISHLYLLGVLEEAGLAPEDVEIVNTPPPDMAVALQTGGVDAIAIWDPWPIVALRDVAGTYEVVRGGGYISFIGYIVAERSWVEQNPEVVNSFLTARARADQWIRENPDAAAAVAVRWLPGMREEVALDAMQYNVQQLDPRFSACNYLALHNSQQLLADLGTIDSTFDVNQHFEPRFISRVMAENPDLFQDLSPIPAGAEISEGYQFTPEQAGQACQ
jgi:sulfonate transport system substrate-binding protein